MDHLRICMDALRRTSSDAEGMRVHLGEQWIDQFCDAQTGNQKGPLKRLLNAIHNQAEQRPSEDFWITRGNTFGQGFVALTLRSRCRHLK